MLTGDVQSEAERIAHALSIPVLASQTLPLQKQAFIQALRESSSHNTVAMLGDGLNDAPALAAADVRIALSTPSASAAARTTNAQTADILFTSPSLSRLPELLEIAQRTVRQASWNLRWAVGYNVLAVSLAMGVAEPVGVRVDAARAGTMMAMSSISVLGWSLWLRRELTGVEWRGGKGEGEGEWRKMCWRRAWLGGFWWCLWE